MTKEIQLTQGKVALVDDEDFEVLSRYKWHTGRRSYKGTDRWFALRKVHGQRRLMASDILGRENGVFYVDGDGLNNTRANLILNPVPRVSVQCKKLGDKWLCNNCGVGFMDSEKKKRSGQCPRCRRREGRRGRANLLGRAKALLHGAKQRAVRDRSPFSLTLDWLLPKLKHGRCQVTGLPFLLTVRSPFCPSLDQLVSRKGYTPENTQVVVAIYNYAKRIWTHNDVLILAKALINEHQRRYPNALEEAVRWDSDLASLDRLPVPKPEALQRASRPPSKGSLSPVGS